MNIYLYFKLTYNTSFYLSKWRISFFLSLLEQKPHPLRLVNQSQNYAGYTWQMGGNFNAYFKFLTSSDSKIYNYTCITKHVNFILFCIQLFRLFEHNSWALQKINISENWISCNYQIRYIFSIVPYTICLQI